MKKRTAMPLTSPTEIAARGAILTHSGDYTGAIELLTEGLTQFDYSRDIRVERARARLELGNIAGAIEDVTAVLEHGATKHPERIPDDVGSCAHTILGIALVQRGDRRAARIAYEHGLAAAPEDPWLRYNLGILLRDDSVQDQEFLASAIREVVTAIACSDHTSEPRAHRELLDLCVRALHDLSVPHATFRRFVAMAHHIHHEGGAIAAGFPMLVRIASDPEEALEATAARQLLIAIAEERRRNAV